MECYALARNKHSSIGRNSAEMPSTAISGMAQYEMLVSHSPPVFSHSPPASFLADYGPNLSRYVLKRCGQVAENVIA